MIPMCKEFIDDSPLLSIHDGSTHQTSGIPAALPSHVPEKSVGENVYYVYEYCMCVCVLCGIISVSGMVLARAGTLVVDTLFSHIN